MQMRHSDNCKINSDSLLHIPSYPLHAHIFLGLLSAHAGTGSKTAGFAKSTRKGSTWEEGMSPLHLMGVILIPCAERQHLQWRCIGKFQIGKVPVKQAPLQLISTTRLNLSIWLLSATGPLNAHMPLSI